MLVFASRIRLATFGLAILLAALAAGSLSSPRPAAAEHGCASAGSPAGAYNLTAYEASDWKNTYRRTLDYAGLNQLFPELPNFALPALESGSRSSGSSTTTTPYVPPAILKAITWIESSWQMAASTVPYGTVGPPLVSHSCAYGISQIVSGMENTGGAPTLDQTSIGSHYGLNAARGARILGGKWNLAPEYRPIVGNRDPTRVENWYYAIWSYHGFSFANHPLNPAFSPQRGVFQCNGTQSYNSFPYQELVLGCVKNPPVVGGSRLWDPVSVTLPSLSSPAFNLTAWNNCWASYSCDSMDFSTPSPSHTDPATTSGSRSTAIGNPTGVLTPSSISKVVKSGSSSGSIPVTISNTGTGPLSWRLSPSVSWLKLSKIQGVSLGADIGPQPASASASINASGLATGNYSGEIHLQSLYSLGLPEKTIVNLSVPPTSWRLDQSQMLAPDFNGDGRNDVVGAYDSGSSQLRLWAFTSNGVDFSKVHPAYTGCPGCWDLDRAQMLVADVNGDNKEDIVGVYDYGDNRLGIWTFISDGGNFSTVRQAYLGCSGCWDVGRSRFVVADVNGDNKDDIVGAYDYGGGKMRAWNFVSDGQFFSTVTQAYNGCNSCWYLDRSQITSADVNGDGKDDLIGVYDYGDHNMSAWSFLSNGAAFSTTRKIYTSCLGCWDLERSRFSGEDLNGDGKGDVLATYDYGGGVMGMWSFNSNGTALASPTRSFKSCDGCWHVSRSQMIAGDVNKDGKGDVVGVYDYGNGVMGMWHFVSGSAFSTYRSY